MRVIVVCVLRFIASEFSLACEEREAEELVTSLRSKSDVATTTKRGARNRDRDLIGLHAFSRYISPQSKEDAL